MPDEPVTVTDPAAPAAQTEPPTPPNDPPAELGDAGKKALDAERDARKAAEKVARETQKELDALRQASMSEQEKAVAVAKTEGRAEAMQALGSKLAAAEIRAAAAGRLNDEQLVTLLDGLNLTAFVNDDGEVDQAKVVKFVDGIAPKTDTPVFPDLGQGARQPLASGSDPLLEALKRTVGA